MANLIVDEAQVRTRRTPRRCQSATCLASVHARHVDSSALVLVYHHTDPHSYVLSLALAFSIHNNQQSAVQGDKTFKILYRFVQ